MAENYKVHKIYANYPMDALSLRELEGDINELQLNLGDWVVVDCKGMTYISSSGLRVILSTHKQLAASGGRFVIRNLNPEVRSVFDMTGFSRILKIE